MFSIDFAFRKEIEAIKQEGGGSHSYINSYLNEIEKNKTLNLGNTFNGMHFYYIYKIYQKSNETIPRIIIQYRTKVSCESRISQGCHIWLILAIFIIFFNLKYVPVAIFVLINDLYYSGIE